MATSHTVSNATELSSVLKSLKGGETVYLKPGDYGNLSLSSKTISTNLSSEVTFTSLDKDAPAEFNKILLNGVKNITIDSVRIDLTDHTYPDMGIQVSNSKNITIANNDVGSDGGTATPTQAVGISVRGSEGVLLDNNSIHNVGWGSTVHQSSHVTVSGNVYKDNLGDNARYAADIEHIKVIDNTFYTPDITNPLNTHQDNIQFWTNQGTKDSAHIEISGNTIYNYSDGTVQSIFMRGDYLNNADGTANEHRLTDVTITDNVIVANHAHGITVGGVDGVTVTGNTVMYNGLLDNPDSLNIPRININDATDITVTGNVAPEIVIGADTANVTLEGNILIDLVNTSSPNYSGNLFVNGDSVKFPDAADLQPLLGGLLDKGNGEFIGAGSTGAAADAPTAVAHVDFGVEGGAYVYQFDATHSLGSIGGNLAGATYSWNFSDGTTLTGLNVARSFAEPGAQSFTLTVTDAAGHVDTHTRDLNVRDPHLVDVNFDGNVTDTTATASHLTGLTGPVYVDSPYGDALLLSSGSGPIKVSTNDLDYGGATELTVSFTLRADDSPLPRETLVSSHGQWNLFLLPENGAVQISIGSKFLTLASSTALADGGWHDLALTIDGANVKLYVDGAVVGSLPSTQGLIDAITAPSNYGLSIGGTPWESRFDGAIDNLDIYTVALDAAQISTLHAHVTDVVIAPPPPPPPPPAPEPVVPGVLTEGTAAHETLTGGLGNDTVLGGNGNDALNGDKGHDLLDGGSHNDTLDGGAGNDILIGGHGRDVLTGGTGADSFVFTDINHSTSAVADRITDFQSGVDTLDLSTTTYYQLVGAGLAHTLGQLEFASAADGSLTIYDPFSAFSLQLDGASGFSSNDIAFGTRPSGLTDGNDTLTITDSFANQQYGSFVIDAGAGHDTIKLKNYTGDVVDGGAGNDTILSGSGNDLLRGGSGNDVLNGEAHNDTLDGGAGNDTLTGGIGNDVFVFAANGGYDTIVDFEGAGAVVKDVIQLVGHAGITNFGSLGSHITYDLANQKATISLGTGGGPTLTVNGVTGHFTATDFLFG